jgi:hypothetical protein
MRLIRYMAGATLALGAAGCGDILQVDNENNPDRGRVLGTPADVQSLASAQFQSIVNATIGASNRVNVGMLAMSFETAALLGNNGLVRGNLPRLGIDNARGAQYQDENFQDFSRLSSVSRNSADILSRVKNPVFTLGPNRAPDENRLKAWAHFTYGVSLGYLSLVYDSAAASRPGDDALAVPPLEGYAAVNAYALAQLDSALAYASITGSAAPSSLPATGWLNGATGTAPVTMGRFQQVIRSYRARMRAGVARNLTERAAVDWQKVVADAEAGITTDLVVNMSPSAGWDNRWMASDLHYRDSNWHQMPYFIIGMADVSGAYDNWLATPRSARAPFLIQTPDLRFPRGATRAAQVAVGQGAPATNAATGDTIRRYFRNRDPSLDQGASGYQVSFYDHYRFRAFASASRVGGFPIFTRAENDLLAAEGHIRRNNIAAAATLIDRTRTTAGLPALSGVVTTADQPVPGGANCVPRVPVGPNFTSTACGNIYEAMKWEKRMETAFTAYGAWYFDSRGWNDLPEGTAVHWPVPTQELDARRIPIYNVGGVGQPGGATRSTYGFGTGDR